MREGISETLVLLSVYGKNLFGTRLGFDGEFEATKVVSELLTPISTRKLEANERDLPFYAEAAPAKFLEIIERDLRAKSLKSKAYSDLLILGFWLMPTQWTTLGSGRSCLESDNFLACSENPRGAFRDRN